jgi:hypothetical protein
MHQASASALLLALVLGAGCSPGNSLGTVPVSGKVTYKGQPVDGALVTFLGEGDARPATAKTTADGSYHLMTLESKGAAPGHYTVIVEKTEELPEVKAETMEEAAKSANKPLPQPKKLLPAKYADAAKTPFQFDVKKGQTNTFDLQLAD